MTPYVSVEKHRGAPSVKVKISDTHFKVYPLTRRGCLAAGRELYAAGAEKWMCSSSVDFPRETKPTFRGDARKMIFDGYSAAQAEAQRPLRSVIAKMIAHCGAASFQDALSVEEKEAYLELIANLTE